jgi:1-acyl-sn-glycerol-3-phosphate acyltransferase
LLLYCLPPEIREVTVTIGKFAYVRSALLSPFVTKSFIAAGRGADVLQTIAQSVAVLKRGDNLVIFPEGTRTRTGRMNRFKPGIGMIVRETGAAVIPVKIRGTFGIWPAGKIPNPFVGRRGEASITFGKRFFLRDLVEKKILSTKSTDDQIAQCIRGFLSGM